MKKITDIIYPAFALFPLVCFGLSSQAQADCQEGCLPNENTVLGDDALLSNIGGSNTAVGFNALLSNTDGNANTAIGSGAMLFNTIGSENTATGLRALQHNTIGSGNTASGRDALFSNTTGGQNTATGFQALFSNTEGVFNVAVGSFALDSNQSANANTAVGYAALLSHVTGPGNCAFGTGALQSDTDGSANTAIGHNALRRSTGSFNTALGVNTLRHNTTGSRNVAIGSNAGLNLTSGSDNIDIGNNGVASEAGIIRIGTDGEQTTTYISGIATSALGTAMAVGVTPTGQLGIIASSERYKESIKPMAEASEALLALRPVEFRYKKTLDPSATAQFGLVAEEVARINPDLVTRDKSGKPFTVRYEAVNAMLLNEFLKEHRKNEEQQATIAQLKSGMEALTAILKEQAAQIEKVSAQFELKKTAPQMVQNTKSLSLE